MGCPLVLYQTRDIIKYESFNGITKSSWFVQDFPVCQELPLIPGNGTVSHRGLAFRLPPARSLVSISG